MRRPPPSLYAFCLPLLAAPVLAQAPADPLVTRMASVLEASMPDLIAFRRDLHQHPELSGAETRTAARVAERLRVLGFEVRTGVGGQGVVALLRGTRPGPVVAFRADLDAVPSDEPDPVPFASLTPGVRHICGHDIHTTVGVALATAFAAVRSELPGAVLLVFQPAEERATGARAMLADDVFSLARPVAIYAVHTAPLEVGTLGVAHGPLLAGRDRVSVTLEGEGDLDAALAALADALRRIGTITPAEARGTVPPDFVLVDLAPPQAEAAGHRELMATLSIASGTARAAARRQVEAAARRVERPGVRVSVSYRERVIAGVTNDSLLTSRGEQAIARSLGAAAVVPLGVVSPRFSEDFGSFQEIVPGAMFLLGVSNRERGWVGMPHSAGYVADEAAIRHGGLALAAVLLDRLRRAD